MTSVLLLLLPPALLALLGALAVGARTVQIRRQLTPLARDLALERTALLRWEGTVDDHPFLLMAPIVGPVRIAVARPSPFTLRRRDPVHDQGRPGVPTGDDGFDRRILVEGEPATCLLALGPAERETLRQRLARTDLRVRPRGLDAQTPVAEARAAVADLRAVQGLVGTPPSLEARWSAEASPEVRARLLAVLGPDTHALAEGDAAREVQHALALARGDREGLWPSLRAGGAAAEDAFRELQRQDVPALGRALARDLLQGAPPPRAEEFLGRLRWAGLVGFLDEQLDHDVRPGRALLRLAAASGAPAAALVAYTQRLLVSTPDAELWAAGLAVLRDHGTADDVAGLGEAPTTPLEATRQRTIGHLENTAVAEALSERFGLRAQSGLLRGHTGRFPVTLTLEPQRAVLTLAELPRALRWPSDRGPQGSGRPLWAWAPPLRRQAAALATEGRLELGIGRDGLLLFESAHLSRATVEGLLAWSEGLADAADRAAPEALAAHLETETEAAWLVTWLELAPRHGLPAPATPSPHTRHEDPHVRIAALAWHQDAAGLLDHVTDPTSADDLRRRAATALATLPSPPWADLVGADALLALTVAVEAAPQPATTRAVLSALGERAHAPVLQPALQTLVLAAPHPDAEPLWLAWLRAERRDPPGLGPVLAEHGTRASHDALREALTSQPEHPDTATRRRALAALRERLQTDGAVSLASGDGALSLADAGEGRLSEAEPPDGERSP